LDFPFKIKPDVSVYRSDSDFDVISDSASSEIFIEFKWKPSDDPFCDMCNVQCSLPSGEDTIKSFLHGTKSANDTLGQITAYAAMQPVDSVVLIDNTLAITMGPLLTMACNCKGHNQQSLCNCNGDN